MTLQNIFSLNVTPESGFIKGIFSKVMRSEVVSKLAASVLCDR